MAKEFPIVCLAPSGKDSLDAYRDLKMDLSQLNHRQDFTTVQYAELLRLAKSNYKFIRYQELALSEKFVLWRHDCDYSLNRSLRLAQLESQESVNSTYFLNPHCEFYNLLEKRQTEIVEKILLLGHDIALHFDAAYYNIESEDQLDALVEREAGWLKNWFGVEPAAFSFHNPTEFLLSCEREIYGGLINCYSRTFKTTVPYCSDSNGYWRFRRLSKVLESGEDHCLQVLTHPGWWQEAPLYPRERIFRSVYGRALAIMNFYDAGLQAHGRENFAGPAGSLLLLKGVDDVQHQLCDYLWNSRQLRSLFIELYRVQQRQIMQFSTTAVSGNFGIPADEASLPLERSAMHVADESKLSQPFLGLSWAEISGCTETQHNEWVKVYGQLIHDNAYIPADKLEEGCSYLCGVISTMAKWGRAQEDLGARGT